MSQKQEIERLISKLQDEDKDARASVAWTLGWMVEEEVVDAVPALILALQDPEPKVRVAVAGALGRMEGVVDPEPALVRALQDSNPEVRAAVAVALGGKGAVTRCLLWYKHCRISIQRFVLPQHLH